VNHGGQDFNPGLGAEIQAIADGVVSNSTDSGGSLGVVMMIDHVINGEKITSVYAHMEYDSRRFEVGDVVEVGDVIGNTGSTGMSTGPHLHFEIRIGGINGTKVDPLEWLWANTN
jgi:murein DD-endopeptidase MepM/ murein hydrolase activator NlpD